MSPSINEINNQKIQDLAESFETQSITSISLYQSALLVHQYAQHQPTLLPLFQSVVQALPSSLLQTILDELNQGFVLLMNQLSQSEKSISENCQNVQSALHALTIIYTSHPQACILGKDINLYVALVEYYEFIVSSPQYSKHLSDILSFLSKVFLDGLFQFDHQDDMDTAISNLMEGIQILENYSETCLGDVQKWQKQQSPPFSITKSIQDQGFDIDSPQVEYLIQMLQSCPTYEQQQRSPSSNTLPSSGKTTKSQKKSSSKKPKSINDPILPLIKQVQSIYPKLGQGYVEIALACYNFDPNIVISHLSSSSILHPRLRGLDLKLPRQLQKSQSYQTDSKEGYEARQDQKKYLQQIELEQEQTSYKLQSFMEYNDDYDDQYDGIGNDGKVGSGTAVDETTWEPPSKDYYDNVKLYNTVLKNELAEDEYWKDMQNTNRKVQVKKNRKKAGNDNNDGENEDLEEEKEPAKKWGPDKGKGGRVIGPDGKYLPFPKKHHRKQKKQNQDLSSSKDTPNQGQNSNHSKNSKDSKSNNKGGGNAKGNANGNLKGKTGGENMTKIQKRRKNDNKAKIGNHNRKDRATRKTGGM